MSLSIDDSTHTFSLLDQREREQKDPHWSAPCLIYWHHHHGGSTSHHEKRDHPLAFGLLVQLKEEGLVESPLERGLGWTVEKGPRLVEVGSLKGKSWAKENRPSKMAKGFFVATDMF